MPRQDTMHLCQHCGRMYVPLFPSNRKRKYCSLVCSQAATRTRIERTCQICGSVFRVPPCDLPLRAALYCSSTCMGVAYTGASNPRWKNRVARICEECGTSFHVLPSRLAKKAMRWCSLACRNIAADAKSSGNRNQRATRTYAHWRRAVLARDSRQCQRCGQVGGEMHAHHIKRWNTHPALRFDVTNGETLCADCHRKHHPWMAARPR